MIKKILNLFTGVVAANVEPFYRAREVWSYRHVDPSTRKVSTRAVLVFRKASDGMFWGLPLTKTSVNGKVLYVPRRADAKTSALSQMRTLKAERLVKKLGAAGEKEFTTLASSIVRMLAQDVPTPKQERVRPRARTYVVKPAMRTLSPFSIYTLQPR
jgi:hypothetical protein